MIFAFFFAFVSGAFAAFAVAARTDTDSVSGVLVAFATGMLACGIYHVYWEERDEK